MRWWFSSYFDNCHWPIQLWIIHFLFASLKLFTVLILKMLTGTLLRIPFFVIGRCSLVPIFRWLQGKFARINLQAKKQKIKNYQEGLPIYYHKPSKNIISCYNPFKNIRFNERYKLVFFY